MTSDKFDKELAALYQQRKDNTVEPYVELQQGIHRAKYSPLKLLSIFLVAGSASFGIMAIISHLSTLPNTASKTTPIMQVTELIAHLPTQPDKQPILAAKPLPPKPDLKAPVTQQILKPESDNTETKVKINMINTVTVQMISLPQLTKPTSTIEPTYKPLPRYSSNAAQAGEIDLSFQVDNSGSVTNIKIIESNVNRTLQRSAKKALSKWRYQANTPVKNELQVRFIFYNIAK